MPPRDCTQRFLPILACTEILILDNCSYGVDINAMPKVNCSTQSYLRCSFPKRTGEEIGEEKVEKVVENEIEREREEERKRGREEERKRDKARDRKRGRKLD